MNRFPCLMVSLLAVSPAVAEPLPVAFTYTAHLRTENGTGRLNLGTQPMYYFPDATGYPNWNDYTTYTPLAEATFHGDHFSFLNGGRVGVAPVGYGFGTATAADAPPTDAAFLLTLDITDELSKQSGRVTFRGRGGVSRGDLLSDPVLFSASMAPDRDELVLGSNLYLFRATQSWPDELEEPAMLNLDVVARVNAPEPATLALAGVGMAAVFLKRRIKA